MKTMKPNPCRFLFFFTWHEWKEFNWPIGRRRLFRKCENCKKLQELNPLNNQWINVKK